jgi:hypothetical protein
MLKAPPKAIQLSLTEMICECFLCMCGCVLCRNPFRKKNTMSTVYEDNYGFYITNGDPEELAFFCYIKSQSKLKLCMRCDQKVNLQEDGKICATCTQALEYGAPIRSSGIWRAIRSS